MGHGGTRYRGPVSARQNLERLVALAALFATLWFVGGLLDVSRHERVLAAPPPPPDAGVSFDAELVVLVGESRGDGGTAAPLEGARLAVYWARGDRYFLAGRAESDGDGRGRLRGLPRGEAWVVVEADGRARASTRLVLDAGPRETSVELLPAHTLRVVVTDEQGSALQDATVLVTGADPLPHGALTSGEGVARFTALGAAPWTVKVAARGYESLTRSGVTSNEAFTLRRLGSLDVRVETADGAAAPGARVSIAGSALWPARIAETGPDGVARIAGLLAGAYDLSATRGDLVSDTQVGLELARGESIRTTLVLAPGRFLVVRVTDGDEEGAAVVPNAAVVVVENGLGSFPYLARTGADGSVRVGPLVARPTTASARAAGFVPRVAVAVPAVLDEPLRIALLRGGTLRGEVVDAAGLAVDGATIEVIGTDLDGLPIAETPHLVAFRDRHFEWALSGPAPLVSAGELGVMPGPVPPIPRHPVAALPPVALVPVDGAQAGEAIVPWVTRHDGAFAAQPVTPGRVRALVRHPAYVEATSDVVTLAPGGEAEVRVVLLAGGALEGRVVDDAGRPVAGVRVDLDALRGTLSRTTLTADDGTFAFAAVPRDVIVSIARPSEPERIVLRTTIEVPEGGREVVELALPGERAEVRFVVRDDSGAAVDTAQITVTSLDPDAPLRSTLFTGPDGTASIPDARGIGVRVVVEAPGWARHVHVEADAPEEIVVRLQAGVVVTGEVTAVRGRRSVDGARVTIVSSGARHHALTDGSGRYRVADVAPGRATVSVEHAGYGSASVPILVERTGRADRELEAPPIDLSEAGAIEGVVVDRGGAGVAGARVALGVAPAYVPLGVAPAGVAVTDRSGRFVLTGIGAGTHVVGAYAPDVGRGSVRSVRVTAGDTTAGVSIRLDEAAAEAEPATSGSVAVTLGERGGGDGIEVVVVHVAAGSDAESAGLTAGDVVTSVDGTRPVSMADARARLSGAEGSDVVVSVERGGAVATYRVRRERVRR